MKGAAEPRYAAVIAAPFAALGIRLTGTALCGIDILPAEFELQTPRERLARRVAGQIERYFESPRRRFTLPLAPSGSAFQERVWAALGRIPPGRTRTYGELAGWLRSAPRAVGQACRANPIPIVIPCHRVVAAAGTGGYAGAVRGRLPEIKHWLLEHESVTVEEKRQKHP